MYETLKITSAPILSDVTMRILHVLNELLPSGAETMLRIASPTFQESGLKSHILATGKTAGPYAPSLEQAGYTVHHIHNAKNIVSLYRIWRFISDGNWDAVHVHPESCRPYYCLMARAAGVRVVTTYHSCFRFSGYLRLRRRVGRWFIRQTRCDQIAIGPSVQSCEKDVYKNTTRIINNWFDEQRFFPPSLDDRNAIRAAHGITNDIFVILTIGNCSPIKNHSALIHALSLLDTSRPWLYLHAGHGAPEADERQLAEKLGLSEKIRFLGRVSNPETLLAAADAFVMCSLNEGMSIAALEAAATGIPMALSEVDGLKDLAPFLTNTKWTSLTPESISESLILISQMPPLPRMNINLSDFAIRKNVERYINAYRGISSIGNP